jgi:iron(III) transport system substrate-binding protein
VSVTPGETAARAAEAGERPARARLIALIAAFFLVLFAPFSVRALLPPPHEAASSADALELRVITPHQRDIRQVFERAFSEYHRARFGKAVRIVYLIPGGTNDMVRYLSDFYDSRRDPETGELPPESSLTPDVDVVFGGGDTTFDRELKPFLKPVRLPAGALAAAFPAPDLAGVALYESTRGDTPPRWVGVVLASFGVVYNPELYRALRLEPPRTFTDLGRPELANLVALADPTRSGSAAVAYMMVLQRSMADAEDAFLRARGGPPNTQDAMRDAAYQAALERGFHDGMSHLLRIAANARYFTDSGGRPPSDVSQGEAAAGMAIDFYARVLEEQVGKNRLVYVTPEAATAVTPDPVAVLYGVRGEREVLANRFIEYLLSPEAQRLWNLEAGKNPHLARSLRRLPIRRDVYADRRDFADDTNPFEETHGFNLRGEWMKLFRDTRKVWAAMFMDAGTDLASAYRAVLAVPNAHTRAALLDRLADVPVRMREIAAEKAAIDALSAARDKVAEDPRLLATRQRIAWAQRFREHYQSVEARARASHGANTR